MKFAAVLLPANKVKGPWGSCLLDAVAIEAPAIATRKAARLGNVKRMG